MQVTVISPIIARDFACRWYWGDRLEGDCGCGKDGKLGILDLRTHFNGAP